MVIIKRLPDNPNFYRAYNTPVNRVNPVFTRT